VIQRREVEMVAKRSLGALVAGLTATVLLVGVLGVAPASATGAGLPSHSINTTPFEICDDAYCDIGVSLPTSVWAFNRTSGTDTEAVYATVRFWVWTNNQWVRYDQGWATGSANDFNGGGGLWIPPSSYTGSDQFVTSMSLYYVPIGAWYMADVWVKWGSNGVTHYHRSQMYRAGM
jgi:hypothetical protein